MPQDTDTQKKNDPNTLGSFLHDHPILTYATIGLALSAVGVAGWMFTLVGTPEDLTDTVSLLAQTLLGVAALGVAVLFSGGFTNALQQRADKDQRSRELVRLSEKMVDTDFYVKVMYPSWEVALKWMDDTRPDIHRYRAEVIGAELRLPKNYLPKQAHALAESEPREHPHYLPYDLPASGGGDRQAVVGELSESLAFATFVRFWRNVQFLIDQKLLDPEATRHLLREWYSWWAPFMTEFTAVGIKIHDIVEAETEFRFHKDGWENGSMMKVRQLQEDVFHFPPYCGRPDGAFEARVNKVAGEIMNHIRDAIEESRNLNVDWERKPGY